MSVLFMGALLSVAAATMISSGAPVCSSWQLRIAEDNPRGWEGHIFEIELFNGDDLISGPGKGTASSDCKHWAGSPEGAFDGDLSTKWVTCGGAAKVGKGITYKLNQPNAVTKVKTHQWGSANNAIPKFDLYCSTDDVTFAYVWTADLGDGVNTKEADSEMAAATAEEISGFNIPTTTTTTSTLDPELARKPRIFMTSEKHSMNLGGIEGADAICTSEAKQPAKALLVDESGCGGEPCRRASLGMWPPSAGRIDWPLLPETSYYNLDWTEELGKTDCHGFISSLSNPVTSECTNQASGLVGAFSTGDTCQSFTSAEASDHLSVGWSCSQDGAVFVGGRMSCGGKFKFLCATTPDLPQSGGCPAFQVMELQNYQKYITGSGHVVVYAGERVALVLPDTARTASFNPDSNQETSEAMELVVSNLQKMLYIYDDVVGMVPTYFTGDARLEGRIPMEVNFIDAAGLAKAVKAGCAVGPAFLQGMFEKALERKSVVDHIFFYENFRNYMFPHVYTKVLDYHTYDGELSWGWVNQGIINIIGCLISEDITPPVAFYYFGKDRGEFMSSMEANLMTYVHDEQYNQENTFMRERLPWRHSSSVDNLYSGLWSFLYRKCGGTEFLKGFFHSLPELLSRAPSSKQDYLTAMENFYIAASIGAKHDLSAFFEGDLRWQIGADALQYVQSKGLAPMSLSATTTTTTTTMPAPVCSSWQLRIAADNPRGWEAHIFEIELFNGDDLISGPGKGTASSDCKRWDGSPEGAFDGDLSTKWVTCGGAAKVGKGITYKLNQPNAVTKVKTHQWGSANNAIPKFDLYCSTDDVTFAYVWTADLGDGVNTKEATE
ncbi:unnamed protein product [Symbiodinium sp. CCMP2456]|nr:unnamed protein product [Symbiodinium sp. CCMP2456]